MGSARWGHKSPQDGRTLAGGCEAGSSSKRHLERPRGESESYKEGSDGDRVETASGSWIKGKEERDTTRTYRITCDGHPVISTELNSGSPPRQGGGGGAVPAAGVQVQGQLRQESWELRSCCSK